MIYMRDKFSSKILSFNEFCISESLRPMYIVYGTDLKNKEWNYSSENETYWTFIKNDKYFYCIILSKEGDVGFATSEFFDQKFLSKWTNVLDFYSFDERKTSSALKVFSYVIFVILEGANGFKLDTIYFSGQHDALGKVYERMVKHNKYFLDSFKEAGYVYDKEENGKYYFRRIQ